MTHEELTPENIISEVRKLQYLYGLKREIRYGQTRPPNDATESVAEHVYGMHLCALYFLPLENPDNTWDRARIFEMITLHDIDEIETGDVIGYTKTDAIRAAEADAMRVVMKKAPDCMKAVLGQAIDEYELHETPEALFVKAIDKFEPLIQVYSDFGRFVCNNLSTSAEESERIKEPHLKAFPIMYSYYRVIHEAMIKEEYFRQ